MSTQVIYLVACWVSRKKILVIFVLVVLGKIDVAQVNPYQSDLGDFPGKRMVHTPPASDSHQLPGGNSRSTPHPWTTSNRLGLHGASEDG